MDAADKSLASNPVADGLQWPAPVSEGDILWLDGGSVGDVRPSSTNAVPLSRLLASSGTLEWHDAIAVILGVADALNSDAGGRPATVPPPDAVFLEADGHFSVVPGSGSQSPLVDGLGALLNRLLRDTPLPIRLRLFASVLESERAKTMAVEEFLGELARWERPGRQQKLAAVYQRARSENIDEPEESAPPVAAVAPSPPSPPDESPSPGSRLRNVTPSVLAAAAGIMLLVAGVITWSVVRHQGGPQLSAPRVTSLPRQEAASVPPARPSERDTRPHVAGKHVDATRRTPALTRTYGHRPIEPEAPAATVASAVAPRVAPAVAASGPKPMSLVEPLRPPSLPVEPVDPNRLFQVGDVGVTAAVLVRPHLPRRPRADIPQSALGFLEIVVDTSGRVESVHLESPANRYREKWWLFAAKDWQFTPAMKDGHAVRFVTRIPLTDLNPSEPQ